MVASTCSEQQKCTGDHQAMKGEQKCFSPALQDGRASSAALLSALSPRVLHPPLSTLHPPPIHRPLERGSCCQCLSSRNVAPKSPSAVTVANTEKGAPTMRHYRHRAQLSTALKPSFRTRLPSVSRQTSRCSSASPTLTDALMRVPVYSTTKSSASMGSRDTSPQPCTRLRTNFRDFLRACRKDAGRRWGG